MKSLTEITPKGIFENGQDLTVELAKQLKGKKIAATWPTYRANDPTVKEFIVGEIVTEWDLGERMTDIDGYDNRQEYWKKALKPKRISEMKHTLELLDSEGNSTFFRHHADWQHPDAEPSFTCSDQDRFVKFIEL